MSEILNGDFCSIQQISQEERKVSALAVPTAGPAADGGDSLLV